MIVVLVRIVLEIRLKLPGKPTGNLRCGLKMLPSSKGDCGELQPRNLLLGPADRSELREVHFQVLATAWFALVS